MPVLGIDFGSKNVVLSTVKSGNVELILDSYSSRSFVPAVFFKNGKRYIGTGAVKTSKLNNVNYAHFDKLSFLQPYDSESKENFFKEINFKVDKENQKLRGKYLKSEICISDMDILTMVLINCHNDAKRFLKTNASFDCSITVPSYYTMEQRTAILKAAKAAKFRSSNLINDLVSTMVEYGFYNKMPTKENPAEHSIVIDWGYSSIQIGLFKMQEGQINQIDDDYMLLGTSVLNQKLAHLILSKDRGDYDLSDPDTRALYVQIMKEMDKIREKFSHDDDFDYNLEYQDDSVSANLKLDEFFALVENEYNSILQFIVQFIEAKQAGKYNISIIIPVGGGMFIENMKQFLDKKFPNIRSSFSSKMMEISSSGACFAECLTGHSVKINKKLNYTSTMLHPIVMSWKEGDSGKAQKDLVVFKHGESYPVEKVATIVCESKSLEINFSYENCPPFAQTKLIATYKFKDIPVKKDSSLKLKAKVSLNNSGVLSLKSVYYEEDKEVQYIEEVPDEEVNGKNENGVEEEQAEVVGVVSNEENPNESEMNGKEHDESKEKVNGETKSPEKPKEQKKKMKKVTKTRVERHRQDLKVVSEFFVNGDVSIHSITSVEEGFATIEREINENFKLKDEVVHKIERLSQIKSGPEAEFIDNMQAVENICSEAKKIMMLNVHTMDRKSLKEKLESINQIYNPLEERIREYTAIRDATQQFNDALFTIFDFINKVQDKHESVDHIEPAEVETLKNLLTENKAWIERTAHFDTWPKNKNYDVKSSTVFEKVKAMLDSSMPIINKPKPKIEEPAESPMPAKNDAADAEMPVESGEANMEVSDGVEGENVQEAEVE